MSRTVKDKPYRLKYEPYDKDYIEVEHYGFAKYRQGKTTKPKKRKHVDTESQRYKRTPSWWTHLFMIKPQRRKGRVWECEVVKSQVIALEEADPPSVGKKPHIYYW